MTADQFNAIMTILMQQTYANIGLMLALIVAVVWKG